MSHKRKTILLYSLLSFLIMSGAILFGFQFIYPEFSYLGLIIGAALMIIAIPLHVVGKDFWPFYFISFTFNSIAIGFSITSYYVFKEYPLELIDFFTAISVSLLVLMFFGAISTLPFYRKHPKLYTALFIFISFVASLILWISNDSFSGLTFYFLNVVYFFMIGMIAASDNQKDLSKEMSLVMFGAFVLISIIVLIIISEGEALSGMDFDLSGGVGVNAKKRKSIE